MRHNWRASLKKFCRLKVLLIQFFPVALSVGHIFACVCEVQLRLCVYRYNGHTLRLSTSEKKNCVPVCFEVEGDLIIFY